MDIVEGFENILITSNEKLIKVKSLNQLYDGARIKIFYEEIDIDLPEQILNNIKENWKKIEQEKNKDKKDDKNIKEKDSKQEVKEKMQKESDVFNTVLEKQYAILNLYQSASYFVLLDAENTLKSLNGDLTGTIYKGQEVESLHDE